LLPFVCTPLIPWAKRKQGDSSPSVTEAAKIPCLVSDSSQATGESLPASCFTPIIHNAISPALALCARLVKVRHCWRCRSFLRNSRYISVATQAAVRATNPSESWGKRSAPYGGGLASLRAVTRVKPEQASKRVMWVPSCRITSEGRRDQSEKPSERLVYPPGYWAQHVDTQWRTTSETCTVALEAAGPFGERSCAGVGGAHGTDEAGESQWRDGALVQERAGRSGGAGDWR